MKRRLRLLVPGTGRKELVIKRELAGGLFTPSEVQCSPFLMQNPNFMHGKDFLWRRKNKYKGKTC